jgi:hypothetical protein
MFLLTWINTYQWIDSALSPAGNSIFFIMLLTKFERLLKSNRTEGHSSSKSPKSGRLKGISGDVPSNETMIGWRLWSLWRARDCEPKVAVYTASSNLIRICIVKSQQVWVWVVDPVARWKLSVAVRLEPAVESLKESSFKRAMAVHDNFHLQVGFAMKVTYVSESSKLTRNHDHVQIFDQLLLLLITVTPLTWLQVFIQHMLYVSVKHDI